MSIVNRIQMKISEKGYNIKSFEKEMNFGNGTIRRWDENVPSVDKIVKVANFLSVSLDWLLLGKEEGNLTPEEQQLLEAYRTASPGIQEATKKLLDVKETYTNNLGKLSESKIG